jgi:hypothetical protein
MVTFRFPLLVLDRLKRTHAVLLASFVSRKALVGSVVETR